MRARVLGAEADQKLPGQDLLMQKDEQEIELCFGKSKCAIASRIQLFLSIYLPTLT